MERPVLKLTKKTHYFAKIIIDLLLAACIAAVVTIPLWAGPIFKDYIGYTDAQYYSVMIILFINGTLSAYILFTLSRMYKTLVSGNPFVKKNVDSFRNISVSCAVIALVFIWKMIMVPSLSTLIVILVFMIGTLFCHTLKDLFDKAVNYKEENDFTV